MEFLDDWYAAEDHQPGKTPMLRVTGTVRFPEEGWTAELQDRGQGINPRILMLNLVVTEPSGEIRLPKITDVPLRYEREVASDVDRCVYDQVHILVVGTDAPDKVLDVECLELPDGNP